MRSYKLSKVKAAKIANDLFFAFNKVWKFIPLRLANLIEGGQMHVSTITLFPEASGKEFLIQSQKINCEKLHPDNVYRLLYGKHLYELTFYDSPEICGYYSTLSGSDNTYVFCNIKELRKDNFSTMFEMSFAFDIETMALIELFDIDYYSIYNCIYEAGDILEDKLRGRILYFSIKN